MAQERLTDIIRKAQELTHSGPPQLKTQNQFFGVGPITDMSLDEFDARRRQIQFEHWLEENYLKYDDKGNVVGNFTATEFGRSMHRGYPADKVVLDMMRAIHRYFGFPASNQISVGLGGGHSGFTVAALHMVNANDASQHIYVDTYAPESEQAKTSGFFRQSWATQLTEMLEYSKNGDPSRLHFADTEGKIPNADALKAQGIKLFFGVGHETTGATTYTEEEVLELLKWIDMNPEEHHAIIDGTSMLGSMPWSNATVSAMLEKCCLFTPFQKAIGGISGYFIFSMTPMAVNLINKNVNHRGWAIPRQLKVAVAENGQQLLSGKYTTALGPIYDPSSDKMLGGIINTYSILAFAETTFGILQNEKRIGDVQTLNQRSIKNRQLVNEWIADNPLFELGVKNPESRGAAVTLIKVNDPDIEDTETKAKIVQYSKQLLGYEGLTYSNGQHEKGLDVARYVNAFPGTDGDYRAWIGGVRPCDDIVALLENIKYCYLRAKIYALSDADASLGLSDRSEALSADEEKSYLAPNKAYKVLIIDLVGMRFNADGQPDCSEVQHYIEEKGGVFHHGLCTDDSDLAPGKIHFFYSPDLSKQDEIQNATDQGQYDALIAAATFIPASSQFQFGGVRIGAGTGNMGSASWGGGNGKGGHAPLMNTPSFNSRATAQMAMKALLKVLPDIPVAEMHERVVAGDFDTGKHLVEYPTTKLEGKKMAVIGYGNIGRELAKLAKAFNMQVTIYAREKHREWIESEGFEYADTIMDAARGKDVISPHLGLGAWDADKERFANAGLINNDVLSVMNDGSVLINYDRGELVDVDALEKALSSGKIRYAAIDADVFKDEASGEISGPMQPYLKLYPTYAAQIELLPHAAADTEHVSRVQGAMQAVDQLFDVMTAKKVVNGVGDIPEGYQDAKRHTVAGVGSVTKNTLSALSPEQLIALRGLSENVSAFWGALEATKDNEARDILIDRYTAQAIQSANQLQTLFNELGLVGPYYE